MDDTSNLERAVELLQQLGLKEYEARAFVALSRMPSGTAKEISDASEVPRTRVYDAVRVLEAKGLVEIQHSNPQRFRAVAIEEAARTLRDEYEERTRTLRERLDDLEPVSDESGQEAAHEVWSLSGASAIRNRTTQLLDEANDEIVLVVGNEAPLTDSLLDSLRAAVKREVSVIVGTPTAEVRAHVKDEVPAAEVFVSGLDWFHEPNETGVEISQLLLVDRQTILVNTVQSLPDDGKTEYAVFGHGFANGLVAIVRRLLATGLRSIDE